MHGRKVTGGGGLSALVAASYAPRAGAETTLLESVSELGGRGRTRVEEGFHFDVGPHLQSTRGRGVSPHRPATSRRSRDAAPA